MQIHKVLNNHIPVDVEDTVLDLIEQNPSLTAIDALATFREVKHTINKLKKVKTPSLNGISPEALEAMDNTTQQTVHTHFSGFFQGKTGHKGWHKSQCVPVPKESKSEQSKQITRDHVN